MSQIREYSLKKLSEIFEETLPKSIEQNIYNHTIRQAKIKCIERSWDCSAFVKEYKTHYLRIYYNVTTNKNASDIKHLVSIGKIKPERLVTMTPRELYPELYEEYDLKTKKLLEYNSLANKKNLGYESIITCGKCKSKEVEYYQIQSRSADEPMTNKCLCLNCGHRFKFC